MEPVRIDRHIVEGETLPVARKIAALQFEAAVFGHGRVIRSGAADHVRKTWG